MTPYSHPSVWGLSPRLPTACLPSLRPHQMSHTSAQSIVILRPQGSRRWLLNSSLLMPTFLPRRIGVTTSMNGVQTTHSCFFQALWPRSQETLLPRELPGSRMALRWGQEKILRNWTGNVVLQSYVSIIYLQNKFWPNACYLTGVCSKHLTKYWILFLFWPFHSMQDHSSPTRDWNFAPCSGSVGS